MAAEKDYTADVDAMLAAVSERTKVVFLANPNNPTGTYVPFDEVKRLHRGLPPHVLLVLDAAYAEYVRRNDYEAGIELVATSENVVMCRTFSKIYGLAAAATRLALWPAHVVDAINRIRGPFNVNAAGDRGRHRGDRRHRACGALARAQRQMARLVARGDRRARARGNSEHGELRADPLPAEQRPYGGGGRRVPDPARADPAAAQGLQAAERAAHDASAARRPTGSWSRPSRSS